MADEKSGGAGKVFMFAAILLGVLAMVMAFAYIQNAASIDNVPKMRWVVAQRDLRANTALTPDDMRVIEVPAPVKASDRKLMESRMLDASALDIYRGERVGRDISAGTPIFLSDIGGHTGDIILKKGEYAMSLSLRGPNALSGLLNPGDYVKLLVTRPTTGAPGAGGTVGASKWETILMLPDAVRVVAVGNRLVPLSRGGVMVTNQVASAGSTEGQQTLTIIVTTEQAVTVQSLCGNGQLPVTVLLEESGPPATQPK